MTDSTPHQERMEAFRAWALASDASPYASWDIDRKEARYLFEQFETAQRAGEAVLSLSEGWQARAERAEEQLDAAREAVKLYWISVGEVAWWDNGQREQIRSVLKASYPASRQEGA